MSELPSEIAADSPDVERLRLGEREIVLVGTAHVARESVDLVRAVIERERPDAVCVELDPQRFEALSQPERWAALDLKQVVRNRQLAPLIANLLLAAHQRRLGAATGVLPGTELLEAAHTAEQLGIPVHLCDRDVRITLRRAWGALSLWKRSQLLSGLVASSFERDTIGEEDLRRLRQRDVLNELMEELGRELPELKRVLIDERDAYIAERIRRCPGHKLVAVVGAGHLRGMRHALESGFDLELAPLETLPRTSRWTHALGWGIPAAILAAFVWSAFEHGLDALGANLGAWALATGVPTVVGAALALAHPLTIALAFFVAPLTTLHPALGSGHVLALVQVYLHPPRIGEFQRISEDAGSLRGWWRSRLLRVLLVFVLTTLGSVIGVWVGGAEIASRLF